MNKSTLSNKWHEKLKLKNWMEKHILMND